MTMIKSEHRSKRSKKLRGKVIVLQGDLGVAEGLEAAAELEKSAAGLSLALLHMGWVRSIELAALEPLLDVLHELRRGGVEVVVTPSWAEETLRLTGRWQPAA